jgi:hypothetical protein
VNTQAFQMAAMMKRARDEDEAIDQPSLPLRPVKIPFEAHPLVAPVVNP